jgi:hypothetical protein
VVTFNTLNLMLGTTMMGEVAMGLIPESIHILD